MLCGPSDLKIKIAVLKHFRILNAADAERFEKVLREADGPRKVTPRRGLPHNRSEAGEEPKIISGARSKLQFHTAPQKRR